MLWPAALNFTPSPSQSVNITGKEYSIAGTETLGASGSDDIGKVPETSPYLTLAFEIVAVSNSIVASF